MTVIVMCGLPASGKTTTAARLHTAAGGTLIRSCDREIAARFHARHGRDAEPECEASDVSVFDDIVRRWQDPHDDGTWPVIARYDTHVDRLRVSGLHDDPAATLIRATLGRTPAR